MDATTAPALELDDIQAGALYERPSPYVGTYLLLRIGDRADGRELVRRLLPARRPGRGRRRARARRLDHRRLHLPRAEGARGAAGVAGQLRAGVPAGHGGPRRRCWATSVRAAPTTGRSRSAAADVHVAIAVLSPDAARLEAVAEQARRAQPSSPGSS